MVNAFTTLTLEVDAILTASPDSHRGDLCAASESVEQKVLLTTMSTAVATFDRAEIASLKGNADGLNT